MLRRRDEPNGPPVPKLDRETLVKVRHATRLLVGVESRLQNRADEAATLLRSIDAEKVVDYWAYEGVVARAVTRAESVGLSRTQWSEDCARYRADSAERRVTQDLVAFQATRALAKAGIRSTVIKGPSMAARLYGDPTLRSASTDVDLLVEPNDLWAAAAAIQRMGWSAPVERIRPPSLPDLHLALPGPGDLPGIELHWRIHWYAPASHTSELLSRCVEVEGSEVVSSSDIASILLLSWCRDGLHRSRLAADIAAWSDRFGAVLPGAHEGGHPVPQLARALNVGSRIAQMWTGAPASTSPPAGLSAIVLRVAKTDYPTGDRSRFSRMALADFALAPKEQRADRFRTTWLRDESALDIDTERLPRAIILAVRLASLTRTAGLLAAILARTAVAAGGVRERRITHRGSKRF